jgi:DNA-binding transcriptional LysR family regulator
MDEYIADKGLQLNILFESNRSETFDAIARTGLAAAIVPQMMLPMTMRLNRLADSASVLHIFPIDISPLRYLHRISLAHHKLCHMTAYRKTFISLVQDVFACYRKINGSY